MFRHFHVIHQTVYNRCLAKLRTHVLQIVAVENTIYKIKMFHLKLMGPGVAQWLGHYSTSRAIPGSRGYRQNHVPWGQLSL